MIGKGVFAPKAQRDERMAKCQACPYAKGGKVRKYTCSKCGCVLQGKVSLAGERCPAGKW